MRIELDANDAIRADEGADALEQVTFAIIVAESDHGTVQSEHDTIERQRGFDLGEDRVAHPLIGSGRGRAARLCCETRAFDQRKTAAFSALARRPEGAGLMTRFGRMRTGREMQLLDESLARGRSGEKVSASRASAAA